MAVGHDGAITDHAPVAGNRHYRKFYMDELENNKEIFKKNMFYDAPIMRGQSRGLKKGFFDSIFGADGDEDEAPSSLKEVGQFKGHVKVFNTEDDNAFRKERKQMIN